MRRRRKIVWGAVAGLAAAVVLFAVTQYVAPTPTGYASKTENVGFYPGCGAGPISQGNLTWYPISREDWATPNIEPAAAAHGSGGRGIVAGVPTVSAPPGPGDDVGTLYVYRDGIAYWRSDSGDLDNWFTLVPQVYYGVC